MEASLIRSLEVQCRVVGALLLRELITRFGRHGLGMLWLVLEPMVFTLGVTALWYFGKMHTVSQLPIAAFALTGYSSLLIWRNAASRCAKAVEPNLALMYHRNVKVIDLMLARVLLEIVGSTASFAVLSVVFVAVGLINPPRDLSLVVGGWLMLAWFAVALGLTIGALSERSELIDRTWHIVTYLLFPLSGAAFMVDWLPVAGQNIVLWMPMVHAMEWLRHGYFGSVVRTHESAAYLTLANALLTLVGLALVRDAERRVQPE